MFRSFFIVNFIIDSSFLPEEAFWITTLSYHSMPSTLLLWWEKWSKSIGYGGGELTENWETVVCDWDWGKRGDHFKRNFANPHNILGQNMWKSVTTDFFEFYHPLSDMFQVENVINEDQVWVGFLYCTQKNWCVEYFLEINWQTFDTHFHFVFVLLNIF